MNGIEEFMLCVVAGYRNFAGDIERFVAAHIKSHVHERLPGLGNILIKSFEHILIVYTPFETIGHSFTGKVIFGHHPLKAHGD